MKVLILSRYDDQGASSRLRIYQFIPWFKSNGIECITSPFLNHVALMRKYQHGRYDLVTLIIAYFLRLRELCGPNKYDLIWIEKEALPWMPAWLESWLLRSVPYVLDYDDAIFHNYDLHSFAFVRRLYGHRIDCLMKKAQLIVAGNCYLAERAIAAGASRVEILPTVVDLTRYKPKVDYLDKVIPVIVWIGSPSTSHYLLDLKKALAELANQIPFKLRVIGSDEISMAGVDVELFPWTLDTEAQLIRESDVGIMPLRASPWEHGKCAYKLIQYMACGLPTVASPIGANNEVTISNQTGLFAGSHDEWVNALLDLLSSRELRQRLGKAGRVRIESKYSLQGNAPILANLLTRAGGLPCVA
jgi:glycosyltransferase involved in cell wall biosynthesis